MIKTNSFIFRLGTALAMTGMTTLAIPMAAVGVEAQEAMAKHAKSQAEARKKEAKIRPSRPLLGAELRTMRGKASQNPYLSGSAKWGINIDGVDITTGNLSLSSTDLSFEGGYGIPVNVTRTYSANNGDEGPLGIGWTLSVDLRSTAGGLLKSGGAPVRSVPVAMKERPSVQTRVAGDEVGGHMDSNEPVSAMLGTDAGGTEQTIQRDVDGVMMPPAWDLNVIETEYETIILDGGEEYVIAKSQAITTPDGTVYTYDKKGEYVRNTGTIQSPVYETGGLADFRSPSTSNSLREPSNVLKIASVNDRHNNTTTYTYSTDDVTFQKVNGIVREKKLTSISMPGGRGLWFTWGSSSLSNRIVSVQDFNSGTGRTVNYGYGQSYPTVNPTLVSDLGFLSSATSPGGKTTRYGYDGILYDTGAEIIRQVMDPRGLVTTYRSTVATPDTPMGIAGEGIYTYLIVSPNGLKKRINFLTTVVGDAGDGIIDGNTNPTFSPSVAASAIIAVLTENPTGLHGTGQSGYAALSGYTWLSGLPQNYSPALPSAIDQSPYIYIAGSRLPPDGGLIIHPPQIHKVYSAVSQNLVRESSFGGNTTAGNLPYNRYGSTKTTWYNFRGQPLREEVIDATVNGGSSGERLLITDYAYWGRDKYFQQKAVKGPYIWETSNPIRYSLTDYYDDQAAAGRKGQTYRVYRTGIDSSVSNTFSFGSGNSSTSSQAVTATGWKRGMAAGSSIHSSEFDYDSKGRAISVKKLQKVVSGTPSYVETTTAYGADGGTTWGMPTSVIEDYGSGRINRTTTTEEYDRSGRAKVVIDGNGRKFRTTYDDDGLVLSVEKWNSGTGYETLTETEYNPDGTVSFAQDYTQGVIVLYGYGSTTATNLGERGQVVGITTETQNDTSSIEYTYDAFGRRATMTNQGSNTARQFKYRDYAWVGMPGQEQPVFKRLTEMVNESNVWKDSKEEYTYEFDLQGRLLTARFAPTPELTTRDTTTGSYYTTADPALSFASAIYTYDDGGRLEKLSHVWSSRGPNDTAYTTEGIRHSAYEYSGDFKLRSKLTVQNGDNSTRHWEAYAYDPKLDYLTEVQYKDTSVTDQWTYDAAGNRANYGYTYDNLNRMTASPHGSNTHDGVGNRTSGGPTNMVYVWDEFNRLEYTQDSYAEMSYDYLPGGLRSTKITDSSNASYEGPDMSGFYDEDVFKNLPTTRYRYDGPMTLEEDYSYVLENELYVDETRYTLGVRGIESIEAERVDGQSTTGVILNQKYRSFPIYDGHGNMICTLERDGTGYLLKNEKRYDVWGGVRSYSNDGAVLNPNKQYCANLGHTTDQESGLIYMRARYYEPWTGRFISEDPARDGENWYRYANARPNMNHDFNGKESITDGFLKYALELAILGGIVKAIQEWYGQSGQDGTVQNPARIVAKTIQGTLMAALTAVLGAAWLETAKSGLAAGMSRSETFGVVLASITYAVVLAMFIAFMDVGLDGLIDGMLGKQ